MKPNTSPISRFQLFVAISYLAIMLIGGTITCVVLAPLQTPDEHSHFLHATALARGAMLPQSAGEYPGFQVDLGYVAFARDDSTNRVPFRYPEKFDRAAMERLYSIRIQNAYQVVTNDTSMYFATGYLPQAIGIRLASLISDRVMVHLLAARWMNCIVAFLVIFLALVIFPSAAPAFIAVSGLPMSLFLISSASQDALLIALSILFAALCLKLLCTSPQLDRPRIKMRGDPRFWAACSFAVVLCLAFGRAPYLTLLLIPASIMALLDWRRYAAFTIGGCVAVVLGFFAQFAYAHQFGRLFLHPGAAIEPQWHGVIANPLVFLKALWRTLSSTVPISLVGMLGWLDTPLPRNVYPVALLVFAGSVVATAFALFDSTLRTPLLQTRSSRAILVLSVMVAVAAAGLLIALLTYLTAAPVGAETGIPLQGRYFIELLPTLVALTLALLLIEKAQVATPAWLTLGRILERSVLVLLLALLPLCFAMLEAILLDRYYLR